MSNSRKTIFDEIATSFWKNIIDEVDPMTEENRFRKGSKGSKKIIGSKKIM